MLVINISPSNVFRKMCLEVKYFQNRQASFGCSECEWVKFMFIWNKFSDLFALCCSGCPTDVAHRSRIVTNEKEISYHVWITIHLE